jgi:cephalosporin hydroxylase
MWRSHLWARTHWLGVPVQQWATDLISLQELIFATRPKFILETGTASGGSAIFYASILELIQDGIVISIDIDQSQASKTIAGHRLSERIRLIQGDSKSHEVSAKVREIAGAEPNLHVFLDSDHSTQHVLGELENFKDLVPVGNYIVVFDTNIAEAKEWRASNPLLAVQIFLSRNPQFAVDHQWEKYRVTFLKNGFLKKVSV